jgi:hypothetical protein
MAADLAVTANGGRCHMSLGWLCRHEEVVFFSNFFERWSFLTIYWDRWSFVSKFHQMNDEFHIKKWWAANLLF